MVEHKPADTTSLAFEALPVVVFCPIFQLHGSPAAWDFMLTESPSQAALLQAGSRALAWIQPQPVAITELSLALSPEWSLKTWLPP